MARPREFDINKALGAAMLLFWERGYEATSVDDLLRRMGINRASLYAAFGEKRALFVQALKLYEKQYGYQELQERARQGSPKQAVRELFEETITTLTETPPRNRRGCLMQNTALELAPHDAYIRRIVRENTEKCHAVMIRVLELAKEKGELDKTPREISNLAWFLFASLSAIRSLGKTGLNETALQAVSDNALRLLD
jgi:TetR/AcrR family transcriptional regulator, transcriptional repressor for nem operon